MEIQVNALKDNTLYENSSGSVSNGAGQYIFVGTTNSGSLRRAVIAFDIADAIPIGSTITSVRLELHLSKTRSGSQTVQIQRLLADWGQGKSNASGEEGGGVSASSNDATWVHRFFDNDTWETAGGDFSQTVSASTSVAGISDYSWGSTPQMAADVQEWLDEPSKNFGWIIRGSEGPKKTTKRFDSMESGNDSNRPVIIVEYTPG